MSSDGAEMSADIVGLGTVVVDLLAVIPEYPRVDTKQDVESARVQVGGPVPTALAQLGRFGHRCHLISRWGDDPLGNLIEADLQTEGISFDRRCRDANVATGHSQVWVDARTGQRTSVTQRSEANGMALSEGDRRALSSARLVHLDGWPTGLSLEAAGVAAAAGAIVVVDTGSPKPGIEQLLSVADVVNAPRRFVEEVFETTDLEAGAAAIARLGPRIVTVTDGEQGAVLYTHVGQNGDERGGAWHRVAALPVSPCVDTNGAGDVFCGGLIHGLLANWTPPKSLRFAAATAALKCRSLGNREALADEPAVMAVLGAFEGDGF